MKFLSEKSVLIHKEFVEKLSLQCSALEKSSPMVIGKPISEIRRRRFLNKSDIIRLRSEIECHNIFFSSFGNMYQSSKCVKNKYNTEASFLYELLELGCEAEADFLGIYVSGGAPYVKIGKAVELMYREAPLLTVDLCEHAYFLDYGFSKREYLKNMLPFLNLGKLDEIL